MAGQHGIIRVIYLYLFALVGLFILVFSAVNGVGAVLDRYVFPPEFVEYDYARPVIEGEKVDEQISEEEQRTNFEKQENNNFKRRVNSAVPGILIGYGLWWFHWGWIRKDREID